MLLATSKYGIAYHSDSARYVSVSKSLLAGTGFLEYTGERYVAGGPLYPAILAAGGVFKMDPLTTARFLHAGLFAATIMVGGAWLARLRPPAALWLLGLVLMMTSAELMDLAINALTDMLFAACIAYSLSRMDAFLRDSNIRSLVLASAAASLACLTRYIGIAILVTGVALLLVGSRPKSLRLRIKEAGIFATIASLPTAMWVFRNYLLSSTTTGKRFPPFHTFTDFASSAVDVVALWFLPSWVPRAARLLLGVVILLSLCVGLVLAARDVLGKRRTQEDPAPESLAILVAASFSILYLGLLVVLGSRSFFSSSAARYTAPAFIPIVVVLIGLMSSFVAIQLRRRTRWWPAGGYVAAALIVVWPARFLAGRIAYAVREGAGGYASTKWQTSEVLSHLRAHPPRGVVFTNEPNAIYFLGSVASPRWIPAHKTPYSPITSDQALEQLRDSVGRLQGEVVVRFSALGPDLASYRYSAADLLLALPLEPLAVLEDGEIYRIRQPEPGGSGK
ncbi:MAG: ArnT family glycosyltransferase [Gemmatimonadaceae bacterium]